jgi:hypothetical protein
VRPLSLNREGGFFMANYRYDTGEVKGKASRTDEGYVRAEAIVTRTGVFAYRNADGSTRRELRHPDDVFERASLDSMKMIPITNNHPTNKLVNSDNAKELTIGGIGENISVDGKFVLASMVITHKDGVDSIDLGRKELSLGYTVDLEKVDGEYNGERYDHRQRNIRYNHLAIVDRARAGAAARIHLDTGDATQTENPNEGNIKMKKVTLDGIEYDAAPEVANALAKATKKATEAQAKLDAANEALNDAQKTASKLEAERDDLQEKVSAKTDAAELQKAVKARVELESVATKVLKADAAKDVSEMVDIEIKKAVIMAKNPSANLDGKDETYIQARFDAVAEAVASEKTTADQRVSMGERADASKKADADESQSAFDAMKSQYQRNK